MSGLGETIVIQYKTHGDPASVLEASRVPLPRVGTGQVLLRMLAAPINPADINMIQGVYPIKPALPAVGGNECVCEVEEVGEDVTGLRPGDWVLPAFSGWGTWRERMVCPASDLLHVSNEIPAISAATLSVNPCTAYRMLHDFAALQPGDVVIQNGANSGVGQAVIQVARKMGLRTVNIVRERPDITELEGVLKGLGATHVVSDAFVRNPEMTELMSSLPKAKLALNCVGGKAAAALLKYLGKGASMVTYGGMSKQPIMAPAGPLIFNDVTLRGFWMTRWNQENAHSDDRENMLEFLCDMIRDGHLKAPICRLLHLSNFNDAINKTMQGFTSQKQILVTDKNMVDDITSVG